MGYKKLYKINEGKKLCGVCGGIAEYFDVDPNFIRLLWVALTCFVGAGLIIYIVAAAILPYKSDVQ